MLLLPIPTHGKFVDWWIFTLYFVFWSITALLIAQIVSALTFRSFLVGSCATLTWLHPYEVSLFVTHTYLLAYKIVQVILYISYPGLAISSSSPTSFYWRRVLEIKICTLGTLVAIGMLLVLGPLLLRQEGNTSVHANPCLYTHL